jgi:hypothetical protein
LPSRPLFKLPGLERHLSSGADIFVIEAAGFRLGPLSGFRSAHPSPGGLIRAFGAAGFLPRAMVGRKETVPPDQDLAILSVIC